MSTTYGEPCIVMFCALSQPVTGCFHRLPEHSPSYLIPSLIYCILVQVEDTNDHWFASRRTLELYLTALGRNCPMTDNEAFVYGYGGLKFVTLNPKLLQVLEGAGFVHLASLHLKVLVNADPAKQTALAKEISNVMFQITSCLRNMMNSKRSKAAFLEGETNGKLETVFLQQKRRTQLVFLQHLRKKERLH